MKNILLGFIFGIAFITWFNAEPNKIDSKDLAAQSITAVDTKQETKKQSIKVSEIAQNVSEKITILRQKIETIRESKENIKNSLGEIKENIENIKSTKDKIATEFSSLNQELSF